MAKRMNVTPADREAWIEYEDYDGTFADRIRTGSEDSTSGLQMFACYAEDARIAEREACAMVAEEHADSCAQARGNAGAFNDRHAVWQAEAERLASLCIAAAIRAR